MQPFIPPTSYAEDRFFAFWERYAPDIQLERQTPIGPYYADFCSPSALVVIEIDGAAYHSSPEQRERDRYRQAFLEDQGYKVIRFSAKEVYHAPVKCVYIARGIIQRQTPGTTSRFKKKKA